MNLERMILLRDRFLDEAKVPYVMKYSQTIFSDAEGEESVKTKKAACGYAACVAGHAVYQFGTKAQLFDCLSGAQGWEYMANELLGLNSTIKGLFTGDPRQGWSDEAANAYYEAKDEAGKKKGSCNGTN